MVVNTLNEESGTLCNIWPDWYKTILYLLFVRRTKEECVKQKAFWMSGYRVNRILALAFWEPDRLSADLNSR